MELICPRCNTKLRTFKYVGYYDEFYGYKCGCAELPKEADSVFIRGAYGSDPAWDMEAYYAEEAE